MATLGVVLNDGKSVGRQDRRESPLGFKYHTLEETIRDTRKEYITQGWINTPKARL